MNGKHLLLSLTGASGSILGTFREPFLYFNTDRSLRSLTKKWEHWEQGRGKTIILSPSNLFLSFAAFFLLFFSSFGRQRLNVITITTTTINYVMDTLELWNYLNNL